MDFWRKITVCLAKGALSPAQHNYLDKQRKTQDLTQQETELLGVFGGKIYDNKNKAVQL